MPTHLLKNADSYITKSGAFLRRTSLDELPQIVACVALVICGIWLVRGPKGKKNRKKPEPPQDEDFTEYTAADPAVPDEDAGFAMPKLAALLGKPVTPEQPEQPEKPEDDDGRAE